MKDHVKSGWRRGRAATGQDSGREAAPGSDFIPFPEEAVWGSVSERFQQQASLYPHRVAIKSLRRSYTYNEVNQWANRLAHAILKSMNGIGNPVGLLLEHGEWSIMAILAVLKSGNMYVPIDPNLPAERITFMLQDTGARLIITSRRNRPVLDTLTIADRAIIDVDNLDAGLSGANPEVRIKGDTLASIIYTSGSTGQPRGVLSAHFNLLQTCRTRTNSQYIGREDRIALLSSYGTGLSRGEIFSALLNGAALLPFNLTPFHPEEEGLGHLAAWLVTERITILSMVPTVFRHFAESLHNREVFPHVRFVMLGGETISHSDLESFKKHFSDHCFLIIHYGMTETCSAVTSLFMDKRTELDSDIIPVGYPRDGYDISIQDDQGRERRAGQTGEIVVKSRFLSPGYWRQPELTSQRFRPCPGNEDCRIYYTGDLGYLTSDGCLYHLGRKDFQVKVRGYRVETGEIERVLLTMAGVSHAAVVARHHTKDECRLVAYIDWNRQSRPSIAELRAHLGRQLPGYMIPADFVIVDKMPLTSGGKIDRRALPPPDFSRAGLDTPFHEPRTSTEKELSRIWSDILHISPIGIDDDFFDLGGHSMAMARLLARIHTQLGKSVPVTVLEEASTIRKLASILDEQKKAESWSPLVAILKGTARAPFFFVHSLTGDVVVYADLARCLDREQPFYGIQARGLDGTEKPFRDLETMATYYIDHIHTVQPEGPYFLGGMCFGGAVAFEMARQLNASGQEVGLLVLIDTPCPPFTGRLPLFQLRRYLWHFRQELSDLLRPFAGTMSRVKHRSLASLLFHLRATMCILRVDRANHYALRAYRPRPYPGRIVHFLRSQSVPGPSRDNRLKWDRVAQGGMDVHVIPGDHHTMLREPNVRTLAGKLNEYLRGTGSCP